MKQPIKSLRSLVADIDRWRRMYPDEDPEGRIEEGRDRLLSLLNSLERKEKEGPSTDKNGPDG